MGDATSGRVGLGRCGAALVGKSDEVIFLTIGGQDVRALIDWRTWSWTESTGGDPDFVDFISRDLVEIATLQTADLDDIETADGDQIGVEVPLDIVADKVVEMAIGGPTALVFAGHVQTTTTANVDPTAAFSGRRTTVRCVGIERDMRRFLVEGIFTGSASNVVLDMIEQFSNGDLTTTGVQLGAPSVGTMQFKQVPLPKALDRVAERVGWFFNMRVRDVQFFQIPAEPNAAPLNETDFGWYYKTLVPRGDVSQLRNRVIVEGAGGTLAQPVVIGQTVAFVDAVDVFEDALNETWPWFVQGETLMETTAMLSDVAWPRTGTITVTETTPPFVEGGSFASSVLLSGDNTSFISEAVLIVVDGIHSFSFLVKEGTAAATNVIVRDTVAAANRIEATVTWAAGVPTVTMVSGTLHRPAVPSNPTVADGWFIFICQATDIVGANTHELRFAPTTAGVTETSEWYIPGVQAGADFNFPIPVEFLADPITGVNVPVRRRRFAWLGNQIILYRETYLGEVILIENFCAFSYELDRLPDWSREARMTLVANVAIDTDGNDTLESIAWDGTGGGSNPFTLGLQSLAVQVGTVATQSDGEFALQVDVRDGIGPLGGTDTVRIAFFEGADFLTATNLIEATFSIAVPSVINTGVGSGNPSGAPVGSFVDRGGGLVTCRVTGTLSNFEGGDTVRVAVFIAEPGGTIVIVPNTDGDSIIAARCGLERGSTFNDNVLTTGPVGAVLGGQGSLIAGIPDEGRFSLKRNYPTGADLFPWVAVENQASQLARSDATLGSWLADGPVEFFKRDRRLGAEGMESSGQLDLLQFIGTTQNARFEGRYTTRDRSVRSARNVIIDVPVGWGVTSVTVTIQRVLTTWMKDNYLIRAVTFSEKLPRGFLDIIQDTKRFTIEEE